MSNFYTRCIIAHDVTVPAWVRELLERDSASHPDKSYDKLLKTGLES